jgi:hypothetical protein
MKKIVWLLLAVLVVTTIYADAEHGSGIQATKEKMSGIILEADNAKAVNNVQYVNNYKTLSSIHTKLDSDYYNKTAAGDYTKAKTLDMLGQLAITSAYAIGTAAQAKQAATVAEQAASLKASSDPQYQAVGEQYGQLSQAIATGNDVQAQSIASSIDAYCKENAPTIDSGYKATPQENSLLAGLGSVLSSSLGTIGSMLTSFGLTKLLTLLGGTALASNPLTMAIGVLLSNTIGAVASSVTNKGVVNWSPVEGSAIGQASSGVGSGTNGLQNALNTNLQQTTPWVVNTDTNAVVEGSKDQGQTKSPTNK